MIRYTKIFTLVLFSLITLGACSASEDGISSSITISSQAVSASETVVNVSFDGAVGAEWSGVISDTEGFVSFDRSATQLSKEGVIGSSAINILYIYIQSNTTESKRSAEVTISLEGCETKSFTITQQASSGSSGEGVVLDYSWAEIPEHVDDDDYQYVTHFTTLDNGRSVRNFTLCFDKKNYAARWVAFPYHTIYDGNVGRNESWQYDPLIEEQYQANLSGSYAGSYDRGHQLASADRQATVEMNKQTFYYSNMTPQWGALNQKVWADFEGEVRDQVCADTLYVVTGADYSTTIGTTTDKSGKACPIPRGYYKVLLRTRSGNSGKSISECSASELKAIGYWFDHEEYSSIPAPVSVAEIESKTGFTFFPTVPDEVKATFSSSLWFID